MSWSLYVCELWCLWADHLSVDVWWVVVVLSDLSNLSDYWLLLCSCVIDFFPDYESIVIIFWGCNNHFTHVLLLLLLFALLVMFVMWLCCLVCKIYSWTSYKFWKSCFANFFQRGRLLFLLIGCIMQNNMVYTIFFGEETKHVGHDVSTYVQHLALVSRLMLLLSWVNFLDVCNEDLVPSFSNVLIRFVDRLNKIKSN